MRRTWHVSSGPLRGFKLTGLLPREIAPVLANSMEKRCSDLVVRLRLEDGTVLDVGGSFGYYALLFSRLVGDKGHVYSFEPDWGSFQRLTCNLAINGIKNVTPVPICISNSTGLAKWVSFDDEPWNSKIVDNLATFESQKWIVVPTMTVNEFVSVLDISADIRLIKIDVEGAELKVLEGMTHLLDAAKPVILCELHGPEIADEIFAFLSERDYEWEMIEYQSETRQHILAFFHAQAEEYRAVISCLS